MIIVAHILPPTHTHTHTHTHTRPPLGLEEGMREGEGGEGMMTEERVLDSFNFLDEEDSDDEDDEEGGEEWGEEQVGPRAIYVILRCGRKCVA